MRDDDHRPAAVGQPAQRNHDLLVHARVQARGRLVEVEQRRLGEQLESDAGALALAAGELRDLPVGEIVAAGGRRGAVGGAARQRQLDQHLLNARVPLRVGRVGRETQLGAELERLAHRQGGVQDVVLRHVADLAPQLVVLRVEVPPAKAHGAHVRGAETGERVEQRRLSGAAGPEHGQQRPAGQPEGHLVQQAGLAGVHRDGVYLECHIAGFDMLDEDAVADGEDVVPDPDQVAAVEQRPLDPVAVDEGPVGRAQVDDLDAAAADEQLRVLAGGHEVIARRCRWTLPGRSRSAPVQARGCGARRGRRCGRSSGSIGPGAEPSRAR